MKEIKLFRNWTIGWYPLFTKWFIGKSAPDNDTSFEICLGNLHICQWRAM